MWFSRFRVLPGSAEAQVLWGGIVKRLLIAYFIGNISAKKISKSIHVRQSYSKPKVGRFWDTVYIKLLNYIKLECGPMPNVMDVLLNTGGALCWTPQSLANAHCSSAVQLRCQYVRTQDLDTK